MKTTFYIIVIIIVSYFLLIFISPSVADNIWSKLGILDTNKQIRDFKSGLDFFSTNTDSWATLDSTWTENTATGISTIEKVDTIQWWIIEARQIITDKISETKTDLDDTRKAVEMTNKNIQKTQESIDATLESIDQVQTSVQKVAQ